MSMLPPQPIECAVIPPPAWILSSAVLTDLWTARQKNPKATLQRKKRERERENPGGAFPLYLPRNQMVMYGEVLRMEWGHNDKYGDYPYLRRILMCFLQILKQDGGVY